MSYLKINPKNILMLKSHSAGIGDILRSSAAWKVLKEKFPEAKLNLLFISNHVGYVSEQLIAKHYLLDSFYVIDKNWFNSVSYFPKALKEASKIIGELKPDFIIDFEPYGLETTLCSMIGRFKYGILTLGINEVFPRGMLYSISAPSVKSFMKKKKIDVLNYTDRDFIVLDRLGLERKDTAITIKETQKATKFRESYREKYGIDKDAKIFVVNVCCGTPDALPKRVDIELLVNIISYTKDKYGLFPVLMGAKFEFDINSEIESRLKSMGINTKNLAGETDIEESVGLINDATAVVSGDSGPYHIAVALRKPTVAIFNFKDMIKIHGHFHSWVRCVYAPSKEFFEDLKREIDSLSHLF